MGWIPRSNSDKAEDNKAPAKTEHERKGSINFHKIIESEAALRLTDDTSSTVADFIILALADLYQKLGNLVLYFHLTKNSRSVVGHGDITIRRDQDLVKPARTERRLDDVGYCKLAVWDEQGGCIIEEKENCPYLIERPGCDSVEMYDERVVRGQQSSKELLTRIASRPCVLTFFPCSRTMMNGRPFYMVCTRYNVSERTFQMTVRSGPSPGNPEDLGSSVSTSRSRGCVGFSGPACTITGPPSSSIIPRSSIQDRTTYLISGIHRLPRIDIAHRHFWDVSRSVEVSSWFLFVGLRVVFQLPIKELSKYFGSFGESCRVLQVSEV